MSLFDTLMLNDIKDMFIFLRFLSGHSDISWLHDINTGNMAKASGIIYKCFTKSKKNATLIFVNSKRLLKC